MKKTSLRGCLAAAAGILASALAAAAPIAVGAAPAGNATAVATKIIKYNFPACQRVSGAVRRSDGAIRASCDGADFLVFTVFNPNAGKVIQVAMNCTAAKQVLNVSCF